VAIRGLKFPARHHFSRVRAALFDAHVHPDGAKLRAMNALAHSAELPVSAPRGVGGSLFLWLSLLLVAYVLSIGPAAKLVDEQIISESAVEPLYAPLILLIENSEPVSDATLWYLTKVWRIDIPYAK